MKTTLLLTLISFYALVSVGQERYIELEVTDSIICEVEDINFILEDRHLSYEEEEKFEEFLTLNNCKYDKVTDTFYFTEASGVCYILKFDNSMVLEQFRKLMEDNEFGLRASNGHVIANHIMSDQETDRLLRKVIEKGSTKAEAIARALDKELGEVASIKEINHSLNWMTYSDFPVRELLNTRPLFISKNKNYQIVESKTLVIRFELK